MLLAFGLFGFMQPIYSKYSALHEDPSRFTSKDAFLMGVMVVLGLSYTLKLTIVPTIMPMVVEPNRIQSAIVFSTALDKIFLFLCTCIVAFFVDNVWQYSSSWVSLAS